MCRGEIIAVGSELLLGGRADTNSLFLSEKLASLGIEVRYKSVVGDDVRDIADAVRIAARRARVVLLTGGLGPTEDDCTRQAVARATGRPLRRRAEALEALRRYLAVRGRTPTAGQLRQALIPSGADLLPNPIGSAPGFCLVWKGCLLAALPGVPSEAESMFDAAVASKLLQMRRPDERRKRIAYRVFHTFGLIETEVEERLKGLVQPDDSIRLGLLASPLGVAVSLIGIGLPPKKIEALENLVQEVRRRLGDSLYAEGTETMEEVVGRHLTQRGLTLAVAESCTGGLIGHRLTQVPGSSAYLDRVAVTYSNRSKQELLGIPEWLLHQYGAVSAEVAAAMAERVRERSHVDIGLSVTGIAGPGGGTEQKPVGLVYVGLDAGRCGSLRCDGLGSMTQEFRFLGDRQAIKLRTSQAALNLLRNWLMKTASRCVVGKPASAVEPAGTGLNR